MSPYSSASRRSLLVLAAALTLSGAVVRSPLPSAAQTAGGPAGRGSASPTVALERERVALPVDGVYDLRVRSELPTRSPYHEVRLRIFRPSGGLLIQKTEIDHDAGPGSVVTTFTRDLGDLGLKPGRYPMEVRVRTQWPDGTVGQTVVSEPMLLYGSGTPRVPLALVVRLGCSPGLDPQGRFVSDPALFTETRDAVSGLAALVERRPDLRFSLAVTPETLDEWSRIAEGYEVSGPGGVRKTAKGSTTARAYADALDDVRRMLATGRVELVTVPYADPDVGGLASVDALGDLDAHLRRGLSAYLTTLETAPAPVAVVFGDRVLRGALPHLEGAGITAVVAGPGAVDPAGSRTLASGAYRAGDSSSNVLLNDLEAAAALSTAATPTALAERILDRAASKDATRPLIAVVAIGPGERWSVAGIDRATREPAGAPWARLVTAAEAACSPGGGPVTLREQLAPAEALPSDYWDTVREARRHARALTSMLGTDDPDAESAVWATMLAESGCWAGPDRSWSLADRGLSFAAAAVRHAQGVLEGVTIEAKDITLSAQKGEVPVSVVNRTGRPAQVTLVAQADDLHFPNGTTKTVRLRPEDNLLELSVDLRSALADDLEVSLWADDVRLGETRVRVRASYLDRLAIVGLVAVALLGMLFFIRRRILAVEAGDSSADDAGSMQESGRDGPGD